MTKITLVLACFVALATPANAAEKLSKQAQKLMAMTPAQFQQSASVKDDSLETVATITTELGFRETHGLLKIVWSDNFMRAFIDKKTGATKYQLYQRILYGGPGWRFYKQANYETPDGPKSVDLTEIGRDVDCSMSRISGGCTYAETVGFEVDEALLKTISASYSPSVVAAWRFKFKSQTGTDFNDGIVPAEIAGLLAAVASYKSAHSLS